MSTFDTRKISYDLLLSGLYRVLTMLSPKLPAPNEHVNVVGMPEMHWSDLSSVLLCAILITAGLELHASIMLPDLKDFSS